MITWWMKLGGNRPPGYDALLFSISGTGSFICPVTQTWLDIPRPLFTQSWITGGKSKWSSTRQIRTTGLSVHSQTRQPPDHDDRPKSEDQIYPGTSTRWDLHPIGVIGFTLPHNDVFSHREWRPSNKTNLKNEKPLARDSDSTDVIWLLSRVNRHLLR